jgi:hypothetical protein
MRHVVLGIDPEQPVEGLTTIGEIVSRSTSDRRFYAVATGSFAAVALLLAVAGLLGVVSRSVVERRREMAIPAALGADLASSCGWCWSPDWCRWGLAPPSGLAPRTRPRGCSRASCSR